MEKLPARPPEDRPRDRTEGAKAACEGCGHLEGGEVARDRDWHGPSHLKRAWLKASTAILVCRRAFMCGPPVGGLFGVKFSSRPHPRKFAVKRFLVVREVAGAVSGVACFGLPPWKKFSAARPRSSRSAQEDGCSSLPCRGVLSFRSEAREASGSETPRFDNVARRRRGGVAARGARAAAGADATHRRLMKAPAAE